MNENFKLFAVGPVEMDEETLEMGSNRLPYFRTDEFSKVMLNIESILKTLVYTGEDSKVVVLTASGSGAMEAAVMNTFGEKDKLLVVSGGSFGHRFKEICDIHGIKNTEIKLNQGEALKKEHLIQYKGEGYTGLLINAHETSTGVLYDLEMVGEFCREEKITFVVDSISSFLADEYYMDKWGIDITIMSSQKALALPPGLSLLVINKKTAEKISGNKVRSLYFNLPDYFNNMQRGQTPFTPAVGIILQLERRLVKIKEIGVNNFIKNTRMLAEDFREKIKNLPFTIPSERMSNAVTPLKPREGVSANEIFLWLKDNYNIYVCPNGGQLKDILFRVGHIGNLSVKDNEALVEALKVMEGKGLI